MNDITLEFDDVWKSFVKGGSHTSLRELSSAIFRTQNGFHKNSDKEFWAISDFSFQVKRGEALAIIGPNGAGKSTTLKILNRILKPTRGSVLINGRMSALIELTAGFHPDLTGRENIYLNGTIFGMHKNEIRDRMDEIIEFSGIPEFIDTPVKRYSSGMYARLGFAIAAHVNPEILLVDEVLSVGDYTFQGKCIRRMQEILKSGTTVVFVSHNMESVLSLCSRAILLRNGRVASEGNPAKVVKDYYSKEGSWTAQLVQNKKATIGNIMESSVVDGAFAPGSRQQYTISINAHEACRLSPGIFIQRDGINVFESNYAKMTGNVLELASGTTTDLAWGLDLNLPPGVYELGFHLEDVDEMNYQQYIPSFRTLLITEDLRCYSQYHMNPRVDLALQS
jgi:lipopolysaccharide transport system ATP-binding protein